MLWRRRNETDITELLMRDFKVIREDRLDMFEVVFHGPENSPYEGGVWRIRVELPPEYPFEPPRLFLSGLICSDCLYWDDLDKGWSSIDDLVDIFEDCIPRLLFDPNIECPANHDAAEMLKCPANHDAAEMLKHDEGEYKQLVGAFCEMFTNKEGMLSENSSGDKESGSEESTSEEGSG
ncbi:hypothetical protein K1719_043522 [Acacia pycnantha]|nr:hypothetical protein K1719_043522 [Acacia pycnantha]